MVLIFTLAIALASVGHAQASEFKILEGHTVLNDYTSPLPYTYISDDDLPDSFTWGDVNGKSYLTHSLNQHIPQYCGSCWAHGAMSALGDRIKIARNAEGEDLNLSIQYILNFGGDIAGSCHGGSATGAYEFVKQSGFVPLDTCLPSLHCLFRRVNGGLLRVRRHFAVSRECLQDMRHFCWYGRSVFYDQYLSQCHHWRIRYV